MRRRKRRRRRRERSGVGGDILSLIGLPLRLRKSSVPRIHTYNRIPSRMCWMSQLDYVKIISVYSRVLYVLDVAQQHIRATRAVPAKCQAVCNANVLCMYTSTYSHIFPYCRLYRSIASQKLHSPKKQYHYTRGQNCMNARSTRVLSLSSS